jgi:hypothetical protein
MPRFSVYGCWPDTRERFAEVYDADSARAAEDTAQSFARAQGAVLWVARVIEGAVPTADGYTAYVDPDDPRNLDRDDLMPDMPELLGADPEWTVFGIAAPLGTPDPAMGWTGERYGDVVPASSPGAAEDVARSRVADNGGVLLTCAVLAGRHAGADAYATFTDPDIRNR